MLTLFANVCGFADTGAKRACVRDRLLLQISDESTSSVYSNIHQGIPSSIIEAARNITEDHFLALASVRNNEE